VKPQHDLRAGEALIRAQHKITDHDGSFWSDVAGMLNAAANRFDLFDMATTLKVSPRETRELNRLVSMANRYMAAWGLNEDGSYSKAGILAMLSGLSLVPADAERMFAHVEAEGVFGFNVHSRDPGGVLIERWTFELTREGKGWDIAELAHEVPEVTHA
jgi:hypothetical protein